MSDDIREVFTTGYPKKDAEIERLKEQNESDYKITVEVCHENTDLKKLITELCDALDGPRFDAIAQRELVQRAREATKCQP
jgi:hypothetical protein